MIGFNFKDGVLHVDDIALLDLAQQHGTPLYVYSARQILHNVERLEYALQKALPAKCQPLIAFAVKANSNQAILNFMRSLGLGCDVVSGGELYRALQAGVPADKIVYSGVGKSDAEIRDAIRADIKQINVESEAELVRIATLAKDLNARPRVAFRLNPEVEAGTHDKISTGRREDKFGLFRDEIEELYLWARDHDYLHPTGLQTHIGSQLTQIDPFRKAFEKLVDFADHLKNRDCPVENLDLGGGLGIIYDDEEAPDLEDYAMAIRDIILPLDTDITLEPGRFLVGDAGILLSKVSYIKEHDDRRYIILDAGMND